jgi:hypothetical protein
MTNIESAEAQQPGLTPAKESSSDSGVFDVPSSDLVEDQSLTGQQVPSNELSTSLIDLSNHDLAIVEDSLWQRLIALKEAEDTLETRLARQEAYVALAGHYHNYGSEALCLCFR